MKSWLNKLINRDNNSLDNSTGLIATPPPKKLAAKKTPQLGFGLQCTPPIGQKKTNQPVSVLSAFTPLKHLDEEQLTSLPHKTLRYKPESVIFLQGTLADAVYYLLNGTVELHPDTEENYDLSISTPKAPVASYEITANTVLAHLPLNSGKVFGATAITKTTADIIVVSSELSQLWAKQSKENANTFELVDIKLPQDLSNNQFYINFAHAYHKNKLQLPSLPNVALKLRNAMQRDISIREAVEIIQIDPAIVTKMIQVANSPLYAPVQPIKNCHDAVARLGLDSTRNLVMSINMKQLFQSKNRQILRHMQNAWKQSIQVSSLCFVLAEEVGGINPEEALLAGLINDIGIIPLLHFAELHADEYPDLQKIIEMIPFLRAPVGRMVLNTLGFSEELSEIPFDAENWFYDSGDKIQLIDIVILAKLHSYLGTEKTKELPYINSIPAYSKLQNGKLNPDFSLSILHKAQQRIHQTMSILA